jgi:hypothetical protein
MAAPYDHDYEMRCVDCATRMFSSRGPELVAARFACPRCRGDVELAPAERTSRATSASALPSAAPATRDR